MIHNAEDLSPDQKAVIETLIGRRILEGEAISVRAFERPAVSADRKRVNRLFLDEMAITLKE
jgi:hypothetical protein